MSNKGTPKETPRSIVTNLELATLEKSLANSKAKEPISMDSDEFELLTTDKKVQGNNQESITAINLARDLKSLDLNYELGDLDQQVAKRSTKPNIMANAQVAQPPIRVQSKTETRNNKIDMLEPPAKDMGHNDSLASIGNDSIARNKAFERQLQERFNAVYEINDEVHLFSKNSLFCMSQESAFRSFFVHVIVNKWFDRFITLCIILNSLMLATKEYDENYNAKYDSHLNRITEQIDLVFSAIFLMECIFKVIGMGFVMNKYAYLRDPWNCIDFFIVLVSLASFAPGGNQSSLKSFRTARILRPLRSIRKLKRMRVLITSFISSIPGVFNVCIFMGFMFTIFAIVGVQFFVGKQYQFCRTEVEITDALGATKPSWEIHPDAPWQCSSDAMCSGAPNNLGSGVVAKCGDVYRDYALDPTEYDGALDNETINYDITNFNSVLAASITIFQVITLEGWSSLMYNYQDTVSYATSSIFFVCIVILGAFTSLNLVLAAIMHSFLKEEEKHLKHIKENQKPKKEDAPAMQHPIKAFNQLDKGIALVQISSTTDNMEQRRNQLSVIEEAQQSQGADHDSAGKSNLEEKQKVRLDEEFKATRVTLDEGTQQLPTLKQQDSNRVNGIRELQERERRVDINGITHHSMLSSSSRDKDESMNRSRSFRQEQASSPKYPFDSNRKMTNSDLGPMSGRTVDNQVAAGSNFEFSKDGRDSLSKTDSATADLLAISNTEQALQDMGQVEKRAQTNCLYQFFFSIVMSVTFNFLIYLFILANTITLALYRFDQSEEQEKALKLCDIVFVWVFTAEMIAKLIGLGVKNYAKDSFNVFDAIIVVIGLIDFALSLSLETDSQGGIMSALRALRLLRVIKLARHWKAFQEILQKMIKSLLDISSFTVLLILFMYIAALLGMEMFAYSTFYNEDGELVFGKANIQAAYDEGQELNWPRENFNDIWSSMVTVFIIIAAEDWNAVMYLYVRAYGYESAGGRPLAIFYFIVLFTIGNTIMMALFTALLLKNFKQDLDKLKQQIKDRERQETHDLLDDDSDEEDAGNPCKSCCDKFCSSQFYKDKYQSFSERFIVIFGGKYALEQHKKARRLKDPKSSASPISGNAVVPVAPPPELAIAIEDQQPDSIVKDITPKSELDIQNYSINASSYINSFSSPDKVDIRRAPTLQRPVALLHYDLDQTEKVKNRKDAPVSQVVLRGRSLYLFKGTNVIRKACHQVAKNRLFDAVIILLIVVSTCTLAFEHPLEDPNSEKMKLLDQIDLYMTSVFCAEAVLKIIALGFIINGKRSYLRDGWNVLDFLIVAFSVISLAMDANLGFIKVLRVARILRPLRLIQRAQGLKIAIQSLFKAFPQIMRLQIVVMFVIFMISILLTTLLSGKLSSCDLSHTGLSFKQQENLIGNKWDCVNYGGDWVSPSLNFDNTLRGMLTLFIFQSREGWVGLMWNSVDAVDVDQSLVPNTSPIFIVLYMMLVVILCLLFVNMFVGIVIETYNLEKDYYSFNQLLTTEQRSWIEVQIMTYAVKPVKLIKPKHGCSIRNICLKLVMSKHFETVIMICILMNTLVMALVWFDEPEKLPETLEYLNYFFMTVFTLEAIVKIIALRLAYFSDSWNKFDFTIVVLTLAILMLQVFKIPVQFGAGPTVLRALRIGRILRLIKQAQQLQIIFHTLLDSAASLGSLGLLLVILFFMFAIIGRSMFGMSKIGDPLDELNEHVNFRDFWTSFLLLMRCSTGESWHLIMFDLARDYSPNYQCREAETYETMMANGGEPFQCGDPLISYVFFVLFHILVFQIFVNLFIAIIIDAFLGQTMHFQLPIKKYSLYAFADIWSHYDPQATGYIALEDLEPFLRDMSRSKEGSQLVVMAEKLSKSQNLRNRVISKLNIPTYDQVRRVMFYDVLQQLCDKINFVKFNNKVMQKNKAQLNVLNKLGFGHQPSEIDVIFGKEKDTGIDFEKAIRNMGRLNPKVRLITTLQDEFTRVHDDFAIYADTESNIKLSEEERIALGSDRLKELQKQGQLSFDDVNLYTTKHIYAVKMIIRLWRERVKPKKLRKSSVLMKMNSVGGHTDIGIQEPADQGFMTEQRDSKKDTFSQNTSIPKMSALKPNSGEEEKLDLSMLSRDMKSNCASSGHIKSESGDQNI